MRDSAPRLTLAGVGHRERMATKSSKRELIEPAPGDKRYVRRDDAGRFANVVDVGKSLAQDVKNAAKKVAPKGQGDRGDQAPPKARRK